ncbi:hypothetical protein LCGC14_2131670 [marine sediment metagenome]|uniref:Uncharacterized protein n=1 Tax=marine sediment metagenome TaxID=412755 RepID=A0A0F9ENF9_9ZZZZ
MPEKKDKLALVREAGEAIREDLAANMRARIGEVVTSEMLTETRDTLTQVFRNYLEMLIPGVNVVCVSRVTDEEAVFMLKVRGELRVSIKPGADDPSLPDPVPAESDSSMDGEDDDE